MFNAPWISGASYMIVYEEQLVKKNVFNFHLKVSVVTLITSVISPARLFQIWQYNTSLYYNYDRIDSQEAGLVKYIAMWLMLLFIFQFQLQLLLLFFS